MVPHSVRCGKRRFTATGTPTPVATMDASVFAGTAMKLQVPFIQLPLAFDAGVLADEIARLGESAWRPHPQGFPGNSAIPLVARDGDPLSDAVQGAMRPTPQLEACPYLMQALHAIGGVWGRSRLMRLSGNAEVTPHVDIDYYWREHMRVHVPIVTQPEVRFHCGDAAVHMAAGECWIFDTWRMHKVINAADRARIHLVADTVGGPSFWEHLGRGRAPGGATRPWSPRHVLPEQAPASGLMFESTNVPVVMTPWEVKEHLTFVLEDALPHPALGNVSQVIGYFHRHWRALWAIFGESSEGWAEYRGSAKAFTEELERIAAGIKLRNGAGLAHAVRRLVTDVAVNDDATEQLADERSGAVAATVM